jgi:transposase InsO family protein
MIAFINDHRGQYGVESMCSTLPIAPSTVRRHAAMARDPSLRSAKAIQDDEDLAQISRVYQDSGRRYGSRKVYHQLQAEEKNIAKCTVERLMKANTLQGVVRGKRVITTNPDRAQPCPGDKVNRQFVAKHPNQLWVSDFTYVSTWSGMVYVAFVIDVFARSIVGWRVSNSMTTQFVLDALNQAIHQRLPANDNGLIHHSDRGSQYLSILYSERLAEAGIDASVGSVGDSYDNALAETTIGLYKTEVTNFLGPWKSMAAVEWETAKWVEWYNDKRIHSALDYITPKQAEEAYFESKNVIENTSSIAA